MIRNLLSLIGIVFSLATFAQSMTEQANRAVFNRIEFFINTQTTDSIYSLASDNFKSQIPAEQLAFVLNNVYQLGKIKNVEVVDFRENTATYRLQFAQHAVQAKFALGDDYHYDLLSFGPAADKIEPKADKTEVLSNVEKVSPLDFFIDSVANTYIKKRNTQSLAIGIFHQNQYKTFSYGETENGNETLPTENTIYEIGSITKVFTAVLLADLVEKKLVQLDDSIIKFLPDSLQRNPSLQGITFKSLANHTSGLPRLPDNADADAGFSTKDPYALYDRKALFAFLKGFKANRPPGEIYEYSNLGFGLLGELLSIVTKKTYIQLLQETILTPLQMVNTTDKADPKKEQILSKVYDDQGEETLPWNFKAMVGAGGLKSNVKDLIRFAVEQFKMPQEELQYAMALTRQFTFFTPENMDIGLAWHMSMLDGLIYFHHTGGTGGSSSFIGLSPDTKTAVVVLSNAASSVNAVSMTIMEKLLEQKNE